MPQTGGQRGFILSFLVGLVLAMAPLVLVGARFAALGEFGVFETPEALPREALHGPLSEPFAEYKLLMTQQIRPDLLVLGSSRVMQVRGSLFNRCSVGTCFYNAGGAAPTTKTAEEFFGRIAANHPPRVMLLGLDIWQFNPNDAQNTHERVELTPSLAERFRRSVGVIREFTPTLLTDPQLRALVAGLTETPAGYRGARAILRGEGFRPDGSYSYGDQFFAEVSRNSVAERSAEAVGRIAKSCCRLEQFDQADAVSVQELERLISQARRSGTQIVVFTPPVTDELMDAVERDPVLSKGFADVDRVIRDVLSRNAVPFVLMTRPADAGCSSAEMLDALHPSEVCAARMVDRLLSSEVVSQLLGSFTDDLYVRSVIASTSSDFFIGRP